ncbi:MAG: hypothetical protein AB7G06_06465 [Bdellovibrionales bacterium]
MILQNEQAVSFFREVINQLCEPKTQLSLTRSRKQPSCLWMNADGTVAGLLAFDKASMNKLVDNIAAPGNSVIMIGVGLTSNDGNKADTATFFLGRGANGPYLDIMRGAGTRDMAMSAMKSGNLAEAGFGNHMEYTGRPEAKLYRLRRLLQDLTANRPFSEAFEGSPFIALPEQRPGPVN